MIEYENKSDGGFITMILLFLIAVTIWHHFQPIDKSRVDDYGNEIHAAPKQ